MSNYKATLQKIYKTCVSFTRIYLHKTYAFTIKFSKQLYIFLSLALKKSIKVILFALHKLQDKLIAIKNFCVVTFKTTTTLLKSTSFKLGKATKRQARSLSLLLSASYLAIKFKIITNATTAPNLAKLTTTKRELKDKFEVFKCYATSNAKLVIFIFGAFFLAITLAANLKFNHKIKNHKTLGVTISKTPKPKPKNIKDLLDTLSLKQKVAQMLIVNIPGNKIDQQDAAFLQDLQPGGIILVAENLESIESAKNFVQDAQKMLKIKAFIAADAEGGTLQNIPWDKEQSNTKPHVQALKEIGANLSLAPVLDLKVEGAYIANRSLDSDPKNIAQIAKQIILANAQNNIGSVGKHYPGLGSSLKDPHQEVPLVAPSHTDFLQGIMPYHELAPSLTGVMTSHFKNGLLDQETPITFSKKWLDYLKDTIGFKGLIITDDLNMNSVVNLNNKYLRAVLAGHDLLLTLQNKQDVVEAQQELVAAVKNGQVKETQINNSVLKILERKQKLKILDFK